MIMMHKCKIALATEGRKHGPKLDMPEAEIEVRDSTDGDPVLIISWGDKPIRSLMIRMDDVRTVLMGGNNV